MPDRAVQPVARGKTFYGGETIDANNYAGVHLEGLKTVFPNTNPADRKNKRNSGDVLAILVRNVSTIALLPGMACTWKAGFRNRRVDGKSRTTAQEVAGFVDDHLPSAGVPVGDLFWLIVEGECLLKTPVAGADFGGDIAEGDILYALTMAASTGTSAGRVTRYVGTFGDTHTTNGTAAAILMNRFARAISAKTTAQTDADILCHVKLF